MNKIIKLVLNTFYFIIIYVLDELTFNVAGTYDIKTLHDLSGYMLGLTLISYIIGFTILLVGAYILSYDLAEYFKNKRDNLFYPTL